MNIIALSLGLEPIPPLPPEVVARQSDPTRDRLREAGRYGAERRGHGPTVRAEILDLLRNTGPATLLDITTYFGMSLTNAKSHLHRLARSGEVILSQELRGGRLTNIYRAAEPTA